MSAVWAYVEGARALVVRQAQSAGTYERLAGRMMVAAGRRRGTVVMPDGENGGMVVRDWNMVRPSVRRRMFRETPAGLEPVWLWFNENGMPRDPHGWHHTFDMANQRIVSLGLNNFHVTAHIPLECRHDVGPERVRTACPGR